MWLASRARSEVLPPPQPKTPVVTPAQPTEPVDAPRRTDPAQRHQRAAAARTGGAWTRLVALGAFVCLAFGGGARALANPALIPLPAQVHYADGWLVLRQGLPIVVPADAPAQLTTAAEVLRDELRQRAGVAAVLARDLPPEGGAIVLALGDTPGTASLESYTLRIGRNAELRAPSARGVLWGAQTLLQSIEAHQDGEALRHGMIVDWPVRPWRALLLDPARSFLSLDFLCRTIRVMSAYKLNVLHLHLTDDQGWRFQCLAFPKCTPAGQPFYSQDELRALVAYAARYGVDIVPEFDFPGHSRAAIAAYPQLGCDGQVRGVDDSILCCGTPFTLQFIDAVVTESAAVFTSPYVHLGADEPFALRRWADCPACRARMKEKGVTTLQALYHTFVLDMDTIVRRHGRRMIVWNDAFHPGVEPAPSKDIVIDAWHDYSNADQFARAGYTLINSSTGPLYLTSFGLRGGLPLSAVRAWDARRFADPDPKGGARIVTYRDLSPQAQLLGGQACAWATEQGLVERWLYPRLLSIADSLWAEGRAEDLASFEARLHPAHDRLLRKLGVYADETLASETLFDGRDMAPWIEVGSAGFVVEHGALVAPTAGPARGWLRTRKSWGSFILTFERWSPEVKDPTGVFVGCTPTQTSGSVPDGRQISATPPAGFLATRSLHPARRWNRYALVVRGDIVTLTINGRLAWSVAEPLPVGAIGLAGADGVRFRAIELRPLSEKTFP